MTETKRDVFEKLAECYSEVCDAYTDETGSPYYCDDEPNDLDEYDTALPDDLPVIPKTVGKYIKEAKFEDVTLLEALGCARDPVFKNLGRWITSHSEEFARAWVLGVWRVDETGEIVKLEEEK